MERGYGMGKKVCAYIGVNKNDSSTIQYIRKVLDLVKEEVEIDFNLYTPKNFPLNTCTGCNQCFDSHKCHLDNMDNMTDIKKELMESDFIIFGSPIYLHNVSGGMKNFIDRLGYWSHFFPLRGKNAMVISSADSNGGNCVTVYLEKILSLYGCPVVTTANILAINNYDDGHIKAHADKMANSLKNPVKSNEIIEKMYGVFKMIMNAKGESGDRGAEYIYWKNNNMLEADTFEKLVSDQV